LICIGRKKVDMMIDADSFAALQKRLQQLDAMPPGLHGLKEAIEAIAATLSVQAKVDMQESCLSARADNTAWTVTLKQNEYHYSYRHFADAGNGREQSTSRMASTIVGRNLQAIAIGLARQKQ
jgi:hypothetical protein